jgi:ribosomal protein S18 acetylase RimI-like enzyme
MARDNGNIQVKTCSLQEAYEASLQIPEFEPWYPLDTWVERTTGKEIIALIARVDGLLAGFKVGYFREDHFYSWVGGVLPEFRKNGVAKALAETQENLVGKAGTQMIKMKTRNRFTAMLSFALGRGFCIERVERKGDVHDWRITLHKKV